MIVDKKKDPDRGRKLLCHADINQVNHQIKRKTPIGDGNTKKLLVVKTKKEIKRKTPIGDGNSFYQFF